jgi:peptidoglycan glycosyltransferase
VNVPIRRVIIVFGLLFLALLWNIEYVQVIEAGSLSKRPDNRRVLLDEYSRERGPILVGGDPVAESVETKDALVYQREYADGPLYGHITGFYSSIYGRTYLEESENPILAGTDNRLFVRRVIDLATGRAPQGGSVLLTIDARAQKAADTELGDKVGAVVAIEPKTGRILAMVSHPTYDPNKLASHSASTQQKAYQTYIDDPKNPMLNRATRQRYPPGSTFKLITAAAALSMPGGIYTPTSSLDSPKVYNVPDTTRDIKNDNGSSCGAVKGKLTMSQALSVSCNTTFAKLGVTIGDDALRAQAEKFGFNSAPMDTFPDVASVFPQQLDVPETAQSSIGQYDVAATPLQMAMVSAGIANGGQVMRPYLSAVVRGPDLRPIEITRPQVMSQAVTPQVAAELTQMMEAVVAKGTGKKGQIPGVRVAGKTGTAQSAPDRAPYAWFTAFAPADNPQVAVAVVIEDSNTVRDDVTGGTLAAPVAKAVIKAVLQ